MERCVTCAVPKNYNHNVLKAIFSLQKVKSGPIPVNTIIQQVIVQMRRKRMLETVITNTLKSLTNLTKLGILARSASSEYGFHRSTTRINVCKQCLKRRITGKKSVVRAKPKPRKKKFPRSLSPISTSEFSGESVTSTTAGSSGSTDNSGPNDADERANVVVHNINVELQDDGGSEEPLADTAAVDVLNETVIFELEDGPDSQTELNNAHSTRQAYIFEEQIRDEPSS